MQKERLEIFSDAVIAIVMTVMVLELHVPEGASWQALRTVLPVFLSYVLSFMYLSIYWNNHHHMLQATDHIDGLIMWANLHLLFWLSLIPFATTWMTENGFAALPTALYGFLLLMAAASYSLLQWAIISHGGLNEQLREVVGKDLKGKVSIALYVLAIPFTYVNPMVSIGFFVLVALMWLVPDRRIEAAVHSAHH
jgi:uncharacterized membrane protein